MDQTEKIQNSVKKIEQTQKSEDRKQKQTHKHTIWVTKLEPVAQGIDTMENVKKKISEKCPILAKQLEQPTQGRHTLPCSVMIKRMASTPTQALQSATRMKKKPEEESKETIQAEEKKEDKEKEDNEKLIEKENEADINTDKTSEERKQTENLNTVDPDKEIPFKKRKHPQIDTEEPSNKKNRTEETEIQITGKETEEEFLEKVLRLEDEVRAEAETENGNNTYKNIPIRKEIQDEIKKEPVDEEEKETESDPDDPEKIVGVLVEDLDMLTKVKQEKEPCSMDAYVEPNSPDNEGGLSIDTEVPPSRPPSRQESTESTRQEPTENSPQILPPHLKNEIRKIFVAQIKEGTDKRVRMTFKTIEKEVVYLHCK
jgi:hypothetical protein